MLGYTLIKKQEMENLKTQLSEFKEIANVQSQRILELEKKIKEYEKTISKLNKPTKDKSKNEGVEDKPVKKVRRKSSKKNSKKEEQNQ